MYKRIVNKLQNIRLKKEIAKSTFFSEQWYGATYKSQLVECEITALEHYLTIGWKKGNDPSPNFSTNGYLVKHKDVKDSGICPLLHYIANGQFEHREIIAAKKVVLNQPLINPLTINNELDFVSCQDVAFQNSTKIAIVCHVYYPALFPKILEYISKLSITYCLYITTNKESLNVVESLVQDKISDYKISIVENVGYDILPFVQTLPQLVEDGIDYVCKLHTKKGAANLESHYEGIEHVWSDLLIKPLISNNNIVNDIVSSFECDENLGFITSASTFKSSKHLMYGNEVMVSKILSSIHSRVDPGQDWGFAAGSMFWSRLDVLLPLLNLDIAGDEDSKTGSVASYWHAMERVLGLLPNISKKSVALSFIVDTENTQYKLGKLGSHYAKYLNRFGVGLTLSTEYSLESDVKVIRSYLPNLANKNIEENSFAPILFYLRYGVFFGYDLIPDFNSIAYWHYYQDVIGARMNPLIHFIKHGKSKGRFAFPSQNNVVKNIEIVANSGLFDEIFYNEENPDVFASKMPAIEHFCRFGWKELRDPAANIDIWHLWLNILGVNHQIINPLVYQAITGVNLPETKLSLICDAGVIYQQNKIKRICLFAGYDAEGVIDQSVIDYVKELSLHADVYYLADSNMAASELDKLAKYTVNTWAFRHGEYDFGSYSRLARNLVGWDVIESYDELILANDSCYLIDSLSTVFNKMHQKKTDWWGMQATKGISKTKEKQTNSFTTKLNLKQVKQEQLHSFERESFYDFHIGSYFLCFRKSVLVGGELKSLLNGVLKERNKLNIIRKYEIGLTRTLINAGYNFDTFIDELYPFHPIYTNNHFELIKQGFPFFKRFFLTENHHHVPQLWQWQDKLLALKPELNLAPLTDNLYRIASNEKLYRNFNITLDENGVAHYPALLNNHEFMEQDKAIKKDSNIWCFPVCAYDSNLSGNDRAVFEYVKNNSAIKKVILTRHKRIEMSGENVEIYPLNSLDGQRALLRSKVIFIKHSPMVNIPFPIDSSLHYFINLWHGIPLKKIGCASLDLQHMLPKLRKENTRNTALICSSDVDKLAMACAFTPLTLDKIWLTGLPRIDTVLMAESQLAGDLIAELDYLRAQLNGRKLVFFCPTFKNGQEGSYYRFSYQEKVSLNRWLIENNYVLGVREHMADSANSYFANLMDIEVIDLSGYKIKNIEVIYRVANILVTDYSSCFIDFMVTGKPIISFAYDYDSYINDERGLFYDMEFAVPGDICKNFTELKRALNRVVEEQNPYIQQQAYNSKRALFFKYIDAHNSSRLVNRVLKLVENKTGL